MINISMEKEAKNGEFEICEKLEGGVVVSFLNVKTAKESRAFNKDIGEYFILDFKKDELFNKKTQNSLVGSAHKCINKLLASLNVDLTKKGALVVGLGNEQIIADAFGAFVAKKILVTRPFVLNDKNKSMIPVSAITPDIYLKTGIETFDMISGVCKSIDPALVVLVDSYGTKKLERVGGSLQLSS
ncbi:MAG: GPR endopeptidase, partial [Clostridia bacterium]